MTKKVILLIIILVFLSGCISAPYATDEPNSVESNELIEGQDYTLYESDTWSETVNKVNKSDSHFLDLGTRTQDGSMHVYIQSLAPYTTYELTVTNIESIDRINNNGEREKVISITAAVKETNDNLIKNPVLTDVHQHIQMNTYVQTDIDYVQAHITNGWNETKTLEREACGCVLKEDPKPNK